MKNLRTLCVATALLMGLAVAASAGERAISKSTLGSMGLGSMQLLSDNDGNAVRGKGAYAAAWGNSSAGTWGAHTSNGYNAVSSHRYGAEASGTNLSFAGKAIVTQNGFFVKGVAAGGSSSAYAR